MEVDSGRLEALAAAFVDRDDDPGGLPLQSPFVLVEEAWVLFSFVLLVDRTLQALVYLVAWVGKLESASELVRRTDLLVSHPHTYYRDSDCFLHR